MTSLSFPKKISKRVSFALDSEEFLAKPKPALVAVYIKGSEHLICSIKTASEIEEEDILALRSLKRSSNGWKPNKRNKPTIDETYLSDENGLVDAIWVLIQNSIKCDFL
jgi:hypothetical protein